MIPQICRQPGVPFLLVITFIGSAIFSGFLYENLSYPLNYVITNYVDVKRNSSRFSLKDLYISEDGTTQEKVNKFKKVFSSSAFKHTTLPIEERTKNNSVSSLFITNKPTLRTEKVTRIKKVSNLSASKKTTLPLEKSMKNNSVSSFFVTSKSTLSQKKVTKFKNVSGSSEVTNKPVTSQKDTQKTVSSSSEVGKTLVMTTNAPATSPQDPDPQDPQVPKRKIIVSWKHHHMKFPFDVHMKKNRHCYVTEDKNFISKADALVLTFPYFNTEEVFKFQRPKTQKWVFLAEESPRRFVKNISSLNGQFNITQSYRLDSDIVAGYGKVWGPSKYKVKAQDYAKGKTKMVAWFVSHCGKGVEAHSRRMAYAKELQKHVQVDIYGVCGNLTCKDRKLCDQMLTKDYKFYLSFENSLCKDYATEKFFKYVRLGIIPIVSGGYDYANKLPKKMVINVQDYNTPKDLADYLIRLDKNDTLYNEYFQWKQTHRVWSGGGGWVWPLCAYLFENESKQKVYENIEQWWGPEHNCRLPAQHFTNATNKILDGG